MMKKILILFCIVASVLNTKAENYFTKPLKDKGVHFIVEAGTGYSQYSSPGGLYKINQTVCYATGILGYDIKSLFIGFGGTACRHTKEHLYSFRAFVDARYQFRNIEFKPYGEVLGGVVGYLKWNDFVKPYYAIGVGIHTLPRLSTGLRVAKVGTLDNQSATEWSVNVSFKF